MRKLRFSSMVREAPPHPGAGATPGVGAGNAGGRPGVKAGEAPRSGAAGGRRSGARDPRDGPRPRGGRTFIGGESMPCLPEPRPPCNTPLPLLDEPRGLPHNGATRGTHAHRQPHPGPRRHRHRGQALPGRPGRGGAVARRGRGPGLPGPVRGAAVRGLQPVGHRPRLFRRGRLPRGARPHVRTAGRARGAPGGHGLLPPRPARELHLPQAGPGAVGRAGRGARAGPGRLRHGGGQGRGRAVRPPRRPGPQPAGAHRQGPGRGAPPGPPPARGRVPGPGRARAGPAPRGVHGPGGRGPVHPGPERGGAA